MRATSHGRGARAGSAGPWTGTPAIQLSEAVLRRWRDRTLVVVGLVGVLAIGVVVLGTSGANRRTRSGVAARVSLAARLAVSRGLGSVDRSYWPRGVVGGLAAGNPVQHLALRFASGGVTVGGGGGWVRFSARGLGRGGRLVGLGTVGPAVIRNRVTYSRRGLSEWYANGPLGLEQGFTVTARPGGVGPVALSLGLSGSLRARLDAGGSALTLLDRQGRAALRYTGLSAFDARGRRLTAWLALDGRRLTVSVDDRGARYPVRIDPYVQVAKLTAGTTGEQVGWSLAISGNTIAAGAPLYPGDGTKVGAVYVFVEPNGGWADSTSPTARLTDSVSAALDHLGQSVGISGDTIVAGAHGNGYVDVWVRPASGWASTSTPTATLTDSSISGNTGFGTVVAISGGTIVVGDPAGGFAYVYVEPGGGWVSATAPNATLQDNPGTVYFGSSVAVSGDTVVVGDPANSTDVGAAFVFVKPAGGWGSVPQPINQTAMLTPSGSPASAALGTSVAIDGGTIVAGAPYWKNQASTQVGAAYVFQEPSTGWVDATQTALLTASDGMTGDEFGWSVDVSGSTIAVGDPQGHVLNGQGAVYMFQEPAAGWVDATETQKLTASDTATNLDLGYAVAIDAGTIAGSADTSQDGRVYVFAPQTPTITTTSLPAGTVGTVYSATVQAAGGSPPYTWSATGLPPGLSIDPATGAITGTPTTAGNYTPTITVTDTLSQLDTRQLPISVAPAGSGSGGGGSGGGGGGGSGSGGGGGGGGTALTAGLSNQTPNVHVGQDLVLSAAGSTIPAGQRAASYRFVIGGQATTCPGQFPVLSAVVTQATSTTASMTVTTTAGAQATTSVPVSIAAAPLTTIKLSRDTAAATATGHARIATASASLGPIGALAYTCTPAGGAGPSPGSSMRLGAVQAAQQAPLTSDPQLPACASDLKVGIIDALGCFEPVTSANPLPAAETKLLCGHEKRDKWVLARLAYDFCLSNPSLPPAFGTPTPGGCNAFTYDSVWESTQPVSIDGLEMDPVNGSRIVLARSGSSGCTAFTSPDSAYLISADAVVKVGGLPITLHVPNYTSAYNQAAGSANCVQNAAGALTNGDLSGADCLGSISIPPISLDGQLLPQTNGPVDLSVGPSDLGVELGEFQIPSGVLPLPILPQLPLSGSLKVNLTGIDSASVAVHLVLPLLSDGMGHNLTGDTTLSIDNTNGLQVDNLDIFVPSLAQLGLARLRDLEFHFKRPSYYEAGGTIDLSDVIDGLIHIHFIFDNGNFQEGDVKYFGGPGGGAPLFGPLFLTELGATLTLNPTHIHGDTQISVGPSLTDNGCGALGIHGTTDIVFGSPWTLDATGEASVLCADLGPSKIFHADSNGNFSYGEHFNFAIPDLGGVDYNEFGSAKVSLSNPLQGIQPGDFLAFQGDLSGSGDFMVNLCHDFGGVVGTQCLPGSPIEVKPSITGTIALGYQNGGLVGGAGVCASLQASLLGQSFSFNVGAGIDNLPAAILGLATDNLPALASQFTILADNCDVSRWRLLPPPVGFSRVGGHSAQTAPYRFTVTHGEKVAIVGLQGRGGAPAVILTGPGGQQIDALRPGINVDRGVLEIRQASSGQTLIEIPHAAPGSWSLQPATGSAPIATAETAHSLPTPKIRASVSGRGVRRVLHYRLTPQAGLRVTFFEGVDGGRVPIGTARGRHGSIRFTPALGSSRPRQLLALLTRNGIPARIIVIGSYRPGAIRPGRASQVRINDSRRGWRISWRPGPYATSQQLTVHFIDGAEVLLAASAHQRSLLLPNALDAGARPTAVAIVALRGQTRGRPAAVVARLRKRHG